MEELFIKIRIAEREYPMRVHPSEEERIRLAGRLVNEKMKTFRDQFGIDDKQDLLAMVAFEVMIEKLRFENEHINTDMSVETKISNLKQMISSVLQEK